MFGEGGGGEGGGEGGSKRKSRRCVDKFNGDRQMEQGGFMVKKWKKRKKGIRKKESKNQWQKK